MRYGTIINNGVVYGGGKGGSASTQVDNSDAWVSTKAYTVGETCIYMNKVWECVINAAAGKTPSDTASEWKQITLSSLNSSIPELLTTITATGTVSISDIKKYKMILICTDDTAGGQLSTHTFPVSLLLGDVINKTIYVNYPSETRYLRLIFTSSTSINVTTVLNAKCRIYGIH